MRGDLIDKFMRLDNAVASWYTYRMSKSIVLRAFAKANVSLNITGKRGGMHELDSVMVSLDAFDTVTVSERPHDDIRVVFTNADVGADNTAYKAARLVRDKIGCGGFDITVEKGIPIGAGLGGSSADGAAVLRALDLFYGLPKLGVDMQKTALEVGSDVPFMLTGGLARVKGLGDDAFFMENKLKLFAVGIMAGEVSTAAAYKKFDELYTDSSFCPADNDRICELVMNCDPSAVALAANALTEPAKALCGGIDDAVKLLERYGATACLTGSGGMVLGWFTDLGKFVACVGALKGATDFKVFSVAKTGVLHQWLSRE